MDRRQMLGLIGGVPVIAGSTIEANPSASGSDDVKSRASVDYAQPVTLDYRVVSWDSIGRHQTKRPVTLQDLLNENGRRGYELAAIIPTGQFYYELVFSKPVIRASHLARR